MSRRPVVAVTAGDPCGIGPEVILKALVRPPGLRASFLVIGNRDVFARAARRLRLPLPASFVHCGPGGRFSPGRTSALAGQASLAYLDQALDLWRNGRIDALVTAPVTKWAVARSHSGFTGHTEYLAEALKVRDVAMMFVSDRLRVVLLTRHVPVRRISRLLTPALLERTVRLTAEALRRRFGLRHPRLALCGLNPHAGEGRRDGEEHRVMRPALAAVRRAGVRCEGPFAADGLFAGEPGRYDAVVCAYHDQGLIPFKMASRDAGAQLTLGLPLVRTSPDHGSALDIAGRGTANPGSMRYALELAARLASGRAKDPWRC